MSTTANPQGSRLQPLLRWYFHTPPNVDFRFYQTAIFINACGISFHCAFIILFSSLGIGPLAVFNVVSVGMWLICLWLLRRGRIGASFLLSISEVVAHAVLAVHFLGATTGFQFFLIAGAVATFVVPQHRRRITLLAVALTGLFIGLHFYAQAHTPIYHLAPWLNTVFFIGNIGGAVFLMAAPLVYYMHVLERTEAALAAEHAQSEALLRNILPTVVADRLKHDPTALADSFSAASILFADLVGFTPLTQSLPPAVVVAMLDDLFGRFDELVQKWRLEKIKTVGDAYMVAAGIPLARPDHAEAIAHFALEMQQVLAHYNQERSTDLRLRIGINSGPVTAGVIGKLRFLYDLWGDAVNTASRMESQGIPGEIQITAATQALLPEKFLLEAREPIEVKGKGLMHTYLLKGYAA